LVEAAYSDSNAHSGGSSLKIRRHISAAALLDAIEEGARPASSPDHISRLTRSFSTFSVNQIRFPRAAQSGPAISGPRRFASEGNDSRTAFETLEVQVGDDHTDPVGGLCEDQPQGSMIIERPH